MMYSNIPTIFCMENIPICVLPDNAFILFWKSNLMSFVADGWLLNELFFV